MNMTQIIVKSFFLIQILYAYSAINVLNFESSNDAFRERKTSEEAVLGVWNYAMSDVDFLYEKGILFISKKENIYDVILIIKYNLKPIIKNKGSAIFLHIAKKNYTPTKGCVGISKKDMLFLINKINTKTKIIIS